MYTDGAGSQYKNRFNFVNMTFMKDEFGFDLEWNFHSTSHGKCACDGLGRTLKRSAFKFNLSNTESPIRDANSMYIWATEKFRTKMQFAFVTEDDYNRSDIICKLRMNNVKSIEKTHNYHSFTPRDKYILDVKIFSNDSESYTKNLLK